MSFDPGIDMRVEGNEESIGLILINDFDPLRIVLVIEESDIFFDQFDGGFIDSAMEGNGSVAVDFASGPGTKEVGEIFGSRSEEVKMLGVTLPGGFSCGAMDGSMIGLIAPRFKLFIQDGRRERGGQEGNKLHSDGFEQSLDFSFSLGPVGGAVNERDPQGSRGVGQLVRAVGGPIVEIDFSGKSPFAQSLDQAIG